MPKMLRFRNNQNGDEMKRLFTPEERSNYNLLDMHYDRTTNVIKVSQGNTIEHELAKFLISWELMQNDSLIVTEAMFKHGGRADVLELTTGTVYEILNSETKERFEAKKCYYPRNLTIVGLNAKDVLKKHLKGLI
jgi:hypothetical protein